MIEILETKSYKPKLNETYWYVDIDGSVSPIIFKESTFDIVSLRMDNCFRTEEEATNNVKNVLAEFNMFI